jgi:2-methylisoborneol synthase
MSADEKLVRDLTAHGRDHLVRLIPFPEAPHPAAAEVEDGVRGWVLHAGLYRPDQEHQLARRKVGHLASGCMPDAPVSVVHLTSRYLAWLYAFDDTVAEDAERLPAYLALDLPGLLEHGGVRPGTRADGLTTALAALRRDIVAGGGGPLLPQLARGLRQYLEACEREGPWRATGQPPSLGAYLRDRTHTSGGHPLYLHRLAPGMPALTDPLPSAVVGLAELAFLIGGLANDLIGYSDEHRAGDPVNAVTVIAHEYRLAPPEAYRATVILHAAHAHRFETEHARLAADPCLTGPQQRFVGAVRGWVAGTTAAVEPYWQHMLAARP